MRAFLGDRLFGGGLAALLAYTLLLQGLMAAVGQGLAAAGGGAVICTAAGLAPVAPPEPTAPGQPAHACCQALCQALGGLAPALPAAQDVPPRPQAATGEEAERPDRATSNARREAGLPEARGPPRRA